MKILLLVNLIIGLSMSLTLGYDGDSELIPKSHKVEQTLTSPSESSNIPIDTLESIVSQINPDSIASYVQILESYISRVVGSESNILAREWIISKLNEYGYSPTLDTCSYRSSTVHNILAYKSGISYPHYYIIIGAHYDVIPGSPGAGDDGTGVAGILEIARILKDRNTHFTFILSFFDAEEVAVVGSSYLADRLKSNGDSVAVMLNMDEISWNANSSNSVRLFYGTNSIAAQRYRSLALSVPSISLNSILMGSTFYSDHYPFQSCGYSVLFTLNYPAAPYRHSARDSSTYVNFDYSTRIIRGVLATALDIDEQYKPSTGFLFEFPGKLPAFASAISETEFIVQISGKAGAELVPGTAYLHYSSDSTAFKTIPLENINGDLFRAMLPALGCGGENVRMYFSGQESGGRTIYYPDSTRYISIPLASHPVIAFKDDFETLKGWTGFEGLWRIGSPTGNGGEFASPDPIGGHNSLTCLAYNLNGDYEHFLPARRVTSPPIDCRGLTNVHLKFWRWLGIQFYGYDYARIAVSNNGQSFTNVWSNNQQTAGGYWIIDDVDISNIADNESTVYIQFIMGPTNDSWAYCGWNIDDLEVSGYTCMLSCCEGLRGNVDTSGIVDITDLSILIDYLTLQGVVLTCPEEADLDVNGIIDVTDLSALVNYLTGVGFVLPNCP